MSNELWEQAEQLAAKNYAVQVWRDETDNGQVSYVASNPELPGCKAHGDTVEEAKANLRDARIDYIYYLLVDNMPVPTPVLLTSLTGSSAATSTVTDVVDMAEGQNSPDAVFKS